MVPTQGLDVQSLVTDGPPGGSTVTRRGPLNCEAHGLEPKVPAQDPGWGQRVFLSPRRVWWEAVRKGGAGLGGGRAFPT